MKKLVAAFALLLIGWGGAEAAEIKVLSTVGMQPATPELFVQFERETGHKISVTYGLAAVLMWTPGTASNAGYPGDDALAQAIVDRGLAHVHPFRGPIREALGLISSARTSVMPDSGLMHFAAASAGGVLGLFADPLDSAPAARWAPLGPRARHLEAPRRVSELADADVFRVLDPLLLEETGSEP